MAKVVIKTRTCPACKYEYQVKEFFEKKPVRRTLFNQVHENVLIRREVINGKEFKMIESPSQTLPREGDLDYRIDYLGMFCPQCGVFLDIDTCTVNKQEKE